MAFIPMRAANSRARTKYRGSHGGCVLLCCRAIAFRHNYEYDQQASLQMQKGFCSSESAKKSYARVAAGLPALDHVL